MSSVLLVADPTAAQAGESTASSPSTEGVRMPGEGEFRAAINKVRHDPKGASKQDWDLANKAAQQAGSLGNDARNALQGK